MTDSKSTYSHYFSVYKNSDVDCHRSEHDNHSDKHVKKSHKPKFISAYSTTTQGHITGVFQVINFNNLGPISKWTYNNSDPFDTFITPHTGTYSINYTYEVITTAPDANLGTFIVTQNGVEIPNSESNIGIVGGQIILVSKTFLANLIKHDDIQFQFTGTDPIVPGGIITLLAGSGDSLIKPSASISIQYIGQTYSQHV